MRAIDRLLLRFGLVRSSHVAAALNDYDIDATVRMAVASRLFGVIRGLDLMRDIAGAPSDCMRTTGGYFIVVDGRTIDFTLADVIAGRLDWYFKRTPPQ